MSIFDQKVIKYEMKPLSSLEKVFPDETPVYRMECQMLSGLWGETVSFQVAYTGDFVMRERLDVRVVSELAEHVHVRTVEMVPVGRATNGIVDDNYLKTTSGLYPDLLKDLKDGKVIVYSRQWRSLWVDVDITNEIPAGEYEIELQLIKEGEVVCSAKQKVTVIGTELPKLDIMHTEWMHADCLADYYHVEVFSEEHWKLLENYFQEYVKRDCNMMLTPLFTSPLDTAIGLERTTCQLIDVEVKDGEYVFGFEESYGCLVGTHARDKDAVVAVMTLCEAAAFYKKQGITLWDKMIQMYEKYGYYKEDQVSLTFKGADGAKKMQDMMDAYRKDTPTQIGEYKVLKFRDYKNDVVVDLATGEKTTTGLPKSNVLYFELENDAWFCVRPSGTEPKIKFYAGVKGTSIDDSAKKLSDLLATVK